MDGTVTRVRVEHAEPGQPVSPALRRPHLADERQRDALDRLRRKLQGQRREDRHE